MAAAQANPVRVDTPQSRWPRLLMISHNIVLTADEYPPFRWTWAAIWSAVTGGER